MGIEGCECFVVDRRRRCIVMWEVFYLKYYRVTRSHMTRAHTKEAFAYADTYPHAISTHTHIHTIQFTLP